jgi:hypothetical protein
MQYSYYQCFRFGFDAGVAFVSINHPPINLLDEVAETYEGELEMAYLSRLSPTR